MQLTENEKLFLKKRAHLVRTWPYCGYGVLALLAGLTVWLLLTHPLFVNPFFVMERLNTEAMSAFELHILALLAPVMVLLNLFLTGIMVLLLFSSFSNEKKLLHIIERQRNRSEIRSSVEHSSDY